MSGYLVVFQLPIVCFVVEDLQSGFKATAFHSACLARGPVSKFCNSLYLCLLSSLSHRDFKTTEKDWHILKDWQHMFSPMVGNTSYRSSKEMGVGSLGKCSFHLWARDFFIIIVELPEQLWIRFLSFSTTCMLVPSFVSFSTTCMLVPSFVSFSTTCILVPIRTNYFKTKWTSTWANSLLNTSSIYGTEKD